MLITQEQKHTFILIDTHLLKRLGLECPATFPCHSPAVLPLSRFLSRDLLHPGEAGTVSVKGYALISH